MSTLYMYTFVPIVFLIIVTVMWLLHKVKKTKFIKKHQHQNMKNRYMRNGKKELKLQPQ